jgi:ketosteroid isomerase-like protein
MSRENVELVRRGYEMYASGDLEGLVALIAPDAELADGGGLGITGTASGTRYGPKGFLRSSEEAHEAFENYTVTPEDFTGVGNFVLVRARLRGKGRASGISLDALVFQLWELSDGKVVRSQIFMTEAQALEAVGLSE